MFGARARSTFEGTPLSRPPHAHRSASLSRPPRVAALPLSARKLARSHARRVRFALGALFTQSLLVLTHSLRGGPVFPRSSTTPSNRGRGITWRGENATPPEPTEKSDDLQRFGH